MLRLSKVLVTPVPDLSHLRSVLEAEWRLSPHHYTRTIARGLPMLLMS